MFFGGLFRWMFLFVMIIGCLISFGVLVMVVIRMLLLFVLERLSFLNLVFFVCISWIVGMFN